MPACSSYPAWCLVQSLSAADIHRHHAHPASPRGAFEGDDKMEAGDKHLETLGSTRVTNSVFSMTGVSKAGFEPPESHASPSFTPLVTQSQPVSPNPGLRRQVGPGSWPSSGQPFDARDLDSMRGFRTSMISLFSCNFTFFGNDWVSPVSADSAWGKSRWRC